MSAAVELVAGLQDLIIREQNVMEVNCTTVEEFHQVGCDTNSTNLNAHDGVCAICLNDIALQETALVKGCEHAYCVTCILRWASCIEKPVCPQCKSPFEFLNIHRALDGSIQDYMFEESVCLLLRASWFVPLHAVQRYGDDQEVEDYYDEDEDDDEDEIYFGGSSSLRIGNRRWGGNGYVSSGRQEARPSTNRGESSDVGPSRERKKKEKENVAKELVGRRAKRALKRAAADKADAAKHQERLARLGRK